MTFDICIATYNSEKWLTNCIVALHNAVYNLKKLAVIVVDNGSTDNTVNTLHNLQQEYGQAFREFKVIEATENKGFGAASNLAAQNGNGNYVFFLNPDTEITPHALTALQAAIKASKPEVAGFELRQFPYEHPKYYNPATLECSWCSGACFVVQRAAFEKCGGFDETIFMYAEDVDLSWRLRALGYRLQYVPAAIVYHYAYAQPGQEKPAQIAGSLVGNLIMRLKYGTEEDIAWWDTYYMQHQFEYAANAAVYQALKKGIKKAKKHRRAYRLFYSEQVHKNAVFAPRFFDLDYEFARSGAFYQNKLPKISTTFSVMVRTYKRPDLLALTLESLTWQTYPHFEVIVVEDGETPAAGTIIDDMRKKLTITYIAPQKHIGRCEAGNLAIKAAQGEYLCFLDDDDYFYPEHLEVMACMVAASPDCKMLVTGAVEAAIEPLNHRGTRWKTKAKQNIAYKQVSYVTLCNNNPFPIQAVMFHKSLPAIAGYLAPELDAFEDWDLWMRYGTHTAVAACEKATSLYKIPYAETVFAKREETLSRYREVVYNKAASYTTQVTAQDIIALTYTPELAQEWKSAGYNGVDYISYKQKLAETAAEIASSTIWRATAPIRVAPKAIAFLLNAIARGSASLAAKATRFSERIGPSTPKAEVRDAAQLNDFILKSRSSVSWKIGHFFAGKKSK